MTYKKELIRIAILFIFCPIVSALFWALLYVGISLMLSWLQGLAIMLIIGMIAILTHIIIALRLGKSIEDT